METITLTPQMLSDIIATAVSKGIRDYEATKGGELSQSKCEARYGAWFVDAVAKGKLQGIRRGGKKNSKITYQVRDIEALRAQEIAETCNIINTK